MQESVAATAIRATLMLRKHYREHRLQARVMPVLYDAISTLCRIQDRHEVAALHERYMSGPENAWHYHGRELRYPIETKFVLAWSAKPPKALARQLADPEWVG